jgi:hypothetical protein
MHPTVDLNPLDSEGVRRRAAAFESHMPLFGMHFFRIGDD